MPSTEQSEVIAASSLRRIAQRSEMILVAVYTAIADEPEEVQTLATRGSEGFLQHWLRDEFAIADALVDAGEVLVNDAPCAQI